MTIIRFSAIAVLVLFTVAKGLAGFQTQGVEQTQVDIKTPPTTDGVTLSISPDGSKIVFAADADGRYQLWMHFVASGIARPLPGTDDVSFSFPCWSPDSQSIAFVANSRLKRLDIETGVSQFLANVPSASRGCSWNHDGTILSVSAQTNQKLAVSAQDGRPLPGAALSTRFIVAPHFLPDGKHYLCYSEGNIYVGELGGPGLRQVSAADSAAVYSSGHLLFVREGSLYALPFDAQKVEPGGTPFLVAKQVPVYGNIAAVSVSAVGDVVYRTGQGGGQRLFKWFDRNGKEIETVEGGPVTLAEGAPALSPDGSSLAIRRTTAGNSDVWLLQLAGGALTRLTSDKANDGFPVWSADGRTIYFGSNRLGNLDLFQKPPVISGKENPVAATLGPRQPKAVTPDGGFLLYSRSEIRRPENIYAEDIHAVALTGSSSEMPVAVGPGAQDFPEVSPDGRFVAYQSNESGRFEIESLLRRRVASTPDGVVTGRNCSTSPLTAN
jgi:Tol biopolymer transport system component